MVKYRNGFEQWAGLSVRKGIQITEHCNCIPVSHSKDALTHLIRMRYMRLELGRHYLNQVRLVVLIKKNIYFRMTFAKWCPCCLRVFMIARKDAESIQVIHNIGCAVATTWLNRSVIDHIYEYRDGKHMERAIATGVSPCDVPNTWLKMVFMSAGWQLIFP